jgi:hypothetical protein
MGVPSRFFSWALKKLALALLLAAVGLTGVGLWNYSRDPADFAARRRELVRTLTREADNLRTGVAGAEARLATTRTEAAAQNARATQAGKVARELDGLSSGLNRLTTDSAQLHENEERLGRMRQMESDSQKRAAELEHTLVRIQWEKDGLEIALERNQKQLADVTATETALVHYAREAWASSGRLVLVVVGLVMVAPVLWRAGRKR